MQGIKYGINAANYCRNASDRGENLKEGLFDPAEVEEYAGSVDIRASNIMSYENEGKFTVSPFTVLTAGVYKNFTRDSGWMIRTSYHYP